VKGWIWRHARARVVGSVGNRLTAPLVAHGVTLSK
jgi:hypothetical protein